MAVIHGHPLPVGFSLPASRPRAGEKGEMMTFLDLPVEAKRKSQRYEERRHRSALKLVDEFACAFPQISYRVLWGSPLINAQAWRHLGLPYVLVYGGLIRHSRITKPGLALTLAHETGHHLGGEPRDNLATWMSCEQQADFWAASVGMPTVFGEDARSLTLGGARQISALLRDLMHSGTQIYGLTNNKRSALFKVGTPHSVHRSYFKTRGGLKWACSSTRWEHE